MADIISAGLTVGGATLSAGGMMHGTIFSGAMVSAGGATLKGKFYLGVTSVGGEKYEGAYVVVPRVEETQRLATRNKTLFDDVTVEEIPIFEVSNDCGGKTLTIGAESA